MAQRSCLTKGCSNEPLNRGLCSGCYQAARRAIKDGVSEKKMIEAGLIMPSASGGKSPWRVAAEKAGVL